MDRSIPNNTLFNEIIRIDFFKIKDVDSLVEKIVELLSKYDYSFKTTDIRNVNINIEDPEALLTQEILKNNISSNINTTKNYEFISSNESHSFVLNEYFLIFEKNNFSSYRKIEEYSTILNNIFNIIKAVEPDLKISRIGIRKMNQLFFGKIDTLEKFFNIKIPDCDYDKINEYSITQKNIDKINYSSNIVMNLKRGKGNTSADSKPIEMFRFIWDIDCYKRDVKIENFSAEIKGLNDNLFEKYSSIITDSFYDIIKKEIINRDELKKLDIYGGINSNGI